MTHKRKNSPAPLQQLRKSTGWSYDQLSFILNMNKSSVSMAARGERFLTDQQLQLVRQLLDLQSEVVPNAKKTGSTVAGYVIEHVQMVISEKQASILKLQQDLKKFETKYADLRRQMETLELQIARIKGAQLPARILRVLKSQLLIHDKVLDRYDLHKIYLMRAKIEGLIREVEVLKECLKSS